MSNSNVIVQRGETFQGFNELTTMCCPDCAVLYAVPARLIEHARKRGNRERVWYCPNGHQLGYNDPPGESEADKLKAQLGHANTARANLASRLEQTSASLRAQKAAAKRARNERDQVQRRARAGVCPCCGRTFQQLVRHMKAKHPEQAVMEPRDAA